MQVKIDGILGINYLGFSPFLLSVRNASLQFLERSCFPPTQETAGCGT